MTLTSIIVESTQALALISAQTLTPDHLMAARKTLESLPVTEAIHAFEAALPPVAQGDEEDLAAERQGDMHDKADQLNKQVSNLKHELDRIKDIQAALHIPQLEELIHSAQQVLRPIYALTSRME